MNTKHNRQRSKADIAKVLLRHIAFISLFLALPLIVAGLLSIYAFNLEREDSLINAKTHLEGELSFLKSELQTEQFLLKLSRKISPEALSMLHDEKQMNILHEYYSKKLDSKFDMYVFNVEGKLVTPRSVRLKSRYLAQKLWYIVNASIARRNQIFKSLKRSFISFLGKEFQFSAFLDGHDNIFQLVSKNKDAFVYWVKSKGKQGVLLIFWGKPKDEVKITNIYPLYQKNFDRLYIRSEDNEFQDLSTVKSANTTESSKYYQLEQSNRRFIVEEDFVWLSAKVEDISLFVAKKLSTDFTMQTDRIVVYFLIALFICGIIFYIKIINTTTFRIPIRKKLILLFLIVGLSPVMIFTFLGYRYLRDKETTLLSAARGTARTKILSLDEDFREATKKLYPNFRKIRDLALQTSKSDELKQMLKNKVEKLELMEFELRSDTSKLIIHVLNNMVFDGMIEIINAFSKFCLDSSLGSNIASSIDPMLNMLIKSPEANLYFLVDRPDEVHLLGFGPLPIFIYWDVGKDENGIQKYIFIAQSVAALTTSLAKAKMKKILQSQIHKPYTIVIKNRNISRWLPGEPVNTVAFSKFQKKVDASTRSIDELLELNGEKYSVTGINGKYLSDYSIFAFYPMKLINKKLARIKLILIFSILFFIFSAAVIGSIFSDTFLLPITSLASGVIAIQKRDSSYRILSDQKDELGDLSTEFNNMIRDFKEMDAAKDVQAALFPASSPVVDGYSIAFENRMASELGGDYCDVIKQENGKLFLIIGDVSGHGVSSALVMAMAKSIVYQSLKDGLSFEDMLGDINDAIYTYFNRKPARKMMTLFVASVDPKTGNIEFLNAGHNYPYLVKNDDTISELHSIHLPMGSRRTVSLSTNTSKIDKGELILFYTDGLVEIKNSQNKMYGYERLQNLLKSVKSLSADEIKARIFQEYERHLGDGMADDDVTIIVVKRLR